MLLISPKIIQISISAGKEMANNTGLIISNTSLPENGQTLPLKVVLKVNQNGGIILISKKFLIHLKFLSIKLMK